MAESECRGNERIDETVASLGHSRQIKIALLHRRRMRKHRKRPHAEIAFERMYLQKIEIDKPRPFGKIVLVVARVISVGKAGEDEMDSPFAPHRPVQEFPLPKQKLA